MSRVRQCEVCKSDFLPAHKHNRTCSRKCGCRIRKGPTRMQDLPTPCASCGLVFQVSASRKSNAKRLFCSNRCRGQFKVTQYAGAKNPNFKNAGWKTCLGCGERFHSYNKKRKFCGVDCGHSYAKAHPMAAVAIGRETELLAQHHAVAHMGYVNTFLMSGSRGPFDMVAIGEKGLAFVQVKYTTQTRPRAGILPKDVEYLKRVPVDGMKMFREFWVYVEGEGWRITRI